MTYQSRHVALLSREGRLKHYGIAPGDAAPRAELAAATRERAAAVVPAGAYGCTIAHDCPGAGLALVSWWAHVNEVHSSLSASPLADPGPRPGGRLAPAGWASRRRGSLVEHQFAR